MQRIYQNILECNLTFPDVFVSQPFHRPFYPFPVGAFKRPFVVHALFFRKDGNGVVNFGEFAAWAGPRLGLELGLVLSKLIQKKHERTQRHKQSWKGVAKMLGKPASQFWCANYSRWWWKDFANGSADRNCSRVDLIVADFYFVRDLLLLEPDSTAELCNEVC